MHPARQHGVSRTSGIAKAKGRFTVEDDGDVVEAYAVREAGGQVEESTVAALKNSLQPELQQAMDDVQREPSPSGLLRSSTPG